MTDLDSILKSRDVTLPTKVHIVKVTVFPVVMYRCESWTIKKTEHWRIDACELGCWRGLLRVLGQQGHQTSQLVMPAPVNQPWIFLGRTDAEAEAPVLVPPDVKSQLTGKDPDAAKDWRPRRRGWQMVGWHHRLIRYEFEQTLGDSEGQGSLVGYSPWGHQVSDRTEELNNSHPEGTQWNMLCGPKL